MSTEKILSEKRGSIIDVRTPEEFMGGHAIGSINMPLNEIPDYLEELKSLQTPLILCCASGGRSSQAQRFLSQFGIECYNGGSWYDVSHVQSKIA